MDGVELCESIKNVYGRSVQVVLLTGNKVEDYVGFDFDGIMSKPVDLPRLYAYADAVQVPPTQETNSRARARES
jgi:CheY-like chemotaxis protein